MVEVKHVGLYVGSFDPPTLGHLDIVRQALVMFDHVQIGIGQNPAKIGKTRFTTDERKSLILSSLVEQGFDLARIGVSTYTGSMMDEARRHNADAIIRGLRQISDFGDEFTINGIVARVLPDTPMVYFICRQDFLHVSSSSAKEMADLGEDFGWMVTRSVKVAMENSDVA